MQPDTAAQSSLRPTLAMIRSLRASHWSKNLLVFAPMVLAHRFDPAAIFGALTAFTALSCVASAGYVVNDLRDREVDRMHPTKRDRPFASGALTMPIGIVMVLALAIGGAMIAGCHSVPLGLTIVVYMVGTSAYSAGLKREPILDCMALAGLYMLRLQAGAIATETPISAWFYAFGGLFFLSLALAKRHVELRKATNAGDTPGRGYRPDDWPFTLAAGMATSLAAVVVYLLYTALNAAPPGLYRSTGGLWGIGAVMAVWLFRLWFLAHRGELSYDPIEFAFRDRSSLLLGLAALGLLMVTT